MKYSDFDLVRGIKSGDKSALDLLIHRWYPRIYGYVFKLIGHEQDSYDVTQDVFVAMMQNIKNYFPWKKFDSWLFTINAWISFGRSGVLALQKMWISTFRIQLPCLMNQSSFP